MPPHEVIKGFQRKQDSHLCAVGSRWSSGGGAVLLRFVLMLPERCHPLKHTSNNRSLQCFHAERTEGGNNTHRTSTVAVPTQEEAVHLSLITRT